MSTKTIKQRIALVAVSALTAGLFTVVSAPAAKATLSTGAQASTLMLATYDPVGTLTADASTTLTSNRSKGWVSDTSSTAATVWAAGGVTYGNSTAGGAHTGVVTTNAKIAFLANSASSNTSGVTVVVTGGTISDVAASTGTASLNGTATAVSVFATGVTATGTPPQNGAVTHSDVTLTGLFEISAAAGQTATITAYTGDGIVGTTTRTAGALIGTWTLTVAAASASGVYNAGESTVTQQACIAKSAAAAGTNSYDTISRCQNGTMGVVYVNLKDAYASNITGGSLAATATNGSLVNVIVSTPASADNYAATAAFDSGTLAASNYVVVTQPTANTAGSTTVTITHQGTVVGTKTINWTGDAASIAVDTVNSSATIRNGASTTTSTSQPLNVVYVVKDAAGNVLSTSTRPTVANATGSMVGATISTSDSVGVVQYSLAAGLGYGVDTINHPGGDQPDNRGAGTYQLKFLKADGSPIYSNTVKVTVSYGTAYTFTASWNAAQYAPGDIGTITITAKDAYGNLISTGQTLAGLNIVTGLSTVGTACSTSSTFLNGVKTCTYSAGNTTGGFAWSVALTTGSSQVPVTGTVKIVDGAVSNAEVLKSIVALIASINKQIAALQKLILKR